MTTRSRAAKIDTNQTSVTDYFRTSRRGAAAREAKTLVDEPVKSTTRKQKEVAKRAVTPEKKAEIEEKIEKEQGSSPPKRSRTNSISKNKTVPKRALFKELTPPNDAVVQESSSSLMASLIVKPEPKKKTKIRTVADLQAELAKRGAAKKIHEQNVQNKIKRVEEQQEIMKSPVKSIVMESNKRGAFGKAKRPLQLVDDRIPQMEAQKTPEKESVDEEKTDVKPCNSRAMDQMKTSRLIEEVKASVNSEFDLPSSYEHLHSAFQHLDRIISIISAQNRTCVLPEVLKNVKNTLKKDFTQKHVAQILHVYPESYHIELREQWAPFGGTQSGKYELIISPNLTEDVSAYVKEEKSTEPIDDLPLVTPKKLMASPMKSPRKNAAVPAPRPPTMDVKKRMDAGRMRDRAVILKFKLLETVKKHYITFLKEMSTDLSKHKRIHPLFDVQKHCPPVYEKLLPEVPSFKTKPNVGMKEYVQNEQIATLPNFVQRALEELKSPVKQMSGGTATLAGRIPLSPAKFAEKKAEEKKSGAMSLIERIRAKEAAKKAAESSIDKESVNRRAMLLKLKERYVRGVCCLYVSKKARSMELEQVADRLIFSSTVPTSKQDVYKHMELLVSIAPDFMQFADVMNRKYLQMIVNDYDKIAELVDIQLKELEVKMSTNVVKVESPHAPRPAPTKKAVRSLFN